MWLKGPSQINRRPRDFSNRKIAEDLEPVDKSGEFNVCNVFSYISDGARPL